MLKKIRTLITVDKRWLFRYMRKYTQQNMAFFTARVTGRRYWEVTEDGVTIKLGFFTPYHQAIAKQQHDQIYERQVMHLWMERVAEARTIYDLGGFNGLYGLLAAKKNPHAQVTIFEPDHVNAEHIRANIVLNKLGNCRTEEAAVAEHTGTATFSQGGTSGEHLGAIGAPVRVVALRDLPQADLIKIDVEGAELQVLKGMGYTTTGLLEVHPLFIGRYGDSEESIASYLDSAGYRVTFIYERDKAKHYLIEPR
jgi:FkbM family methyltransferase